MQPRLLNFLACPDCRSHELGLSILNQSQGGSGGNDIQEGFLSCPGCGETYAIERGIVRMLPHALREASRGEGDGPGKNIIHTAHGYDVHHLRNQPPPSPEATVSPDCPANLDLDRRYFYEYLALGIDDLQSLEGGIVLDAGCGGGRFMAVARANGAADVVGLDLSLGGLLRARALLKGIGGIHLIQGDITRPPFRAGIFDIVYSIGVIHHLADPREGFRALESLLSPGGRLWAWVYGLEGMSLAYRFSHLVWLRRLTGSWPLTAKFRLSRCLALILYLCYLYPLRLVQPVLPDVFSRHLAFANLTRSGYEDIVYAIFDRLQPPYTHYLRKADLEQWLTRFDVVSVDAPRKRGWVVKGG